MATSLVIVAGGAGFIGRNFVKAYSKKHNHGIVVVDKLGIGSDENALHKASTKIEELIADDYGDSKTLERLCKLKNVVGLYDFAAESHVDRSIDGPAEFVLNNYRCGITTAEYARRNPTVPVLHISTDEVFGDKEPFPKNVDSPHNPSNPYSASKAAAVDLIKSYRRTYSLFKLNVSYSCNNFGVGQGSEKFLPKVLNALHKGEEIPLYRPGNQERQWVSVEKHVESLMNPSTYVVGGFVETNLNMILLAAEILKVEPKIKFVADRLGHDVRYELDTAKADQITERERFVEYVRSYTPTSANL
jgi:dTDP-glucose 4,6-dehydratase